MQAQETNQYSAQWKISLLKKKFDEVFNFPKELQQARKSYSQETPYPHVVIDNFISQEIAIALSSDFLKGEDQFNVQYNDSVQKNKTVSQKDNVPEILSIFAHKFSSPEMLQTLETITGLKGLIPDPYWNQEHAFYQIVGPGGVLGSHLDHSHHGVIDAPHVLNMVIYLTEDWNENDGGAFCLFNDDGKKLVKKVPNLYNRCCIFSCAPHAYHGVEPISDKAKKRRHSIYFAYYSTHGAGKNLDPTFPSLDKSKNLKNDNLKYGTYFIVPMNELLKKENRHHLKARFFYFAKLFIPPVLTNLIKRIVRS